MTPARPLLPTRASHPRMLAATCHRQNLVWTSQCVIYSAEAKVWRCRGARPACLVASGPTPQPRHEQAPEARGNSDDSLALQPCQVWLRGLSAASVATLPCVRCVCGLAGGLGYLPPLAMCLGCSISRNHGADGGNRSAQVTYTTACGPHRTHGSSSRRAKPLPSKFIP